MLIFLFATAYLSLAKTEGTQPYNNIFTTIQSHQDFLPGIALVITDTLKIKAIAQNHMDLLDPKKKIKEVAKPRHQSKPEKVVIPTDTAAIDKKAKRQRRPDGLERPPEIPRRGNN